MSKRALASEPEVSGDYPGKRLGVLGLIFALTVAVVGIVVSLVAVIRSARAGHRNIPALAGLVIGVLGTVVFFLAFWFIVQFFSGDIGPCAELGPGTHDEGLVTYECGEG